MFIKINSKDDLLHELGKVRQDFVIHYNCDDCDDEQVTYEEDVFTTDDLIEQFQEHDYLMVNLPCTNCGRMTKFLDVDYIQGIETL